jgi:hypothetical protein
VRADSAIGGLTDSSNAIEHHGLCGVQTSCGQRALGLKMAFAKTLKRDGLSGWTHR